NTRVRAARPHNRHPFAVGRESRAGWFAELVLRRLLPGERRNRFSGRRFKEVELLPITQTQYLSILSQRTGCQRLVVFVRVDAPNRFGLRREEFEIRHRPHVVLPISAKCEEFVVREEHVPNQNVALLVFRDEREFLWFVRPVNVPELGGLSS